jgi:plastocyanin domain-containing protein
MDLRTWTALAAALALGAPTAALAQMQDHGAMPEHAGHHAAKKAVKTVNIAVTSDGFTPADVKVKAGETVKFVVTRRTDKTCAKEIVIRDFGVNQPLPLDKPVTVEITPQKAGKVRYACAMDMIAGTITVE